jgi:hypothetical protein
MTDSMNCKLVENNIWLYEELTDAEKAHVQQHVVNCVECAAVWQRARAFQHVTLQLRSAMPAPSHEAQLTHRIMHALPPTQIKWQLRAWKVGVLGLRAISFVLLIFFVLETRQSTYQLPKERNPQTATRRLHSPSFQTQLKRQRSIKKSFYARYQKQKQHKNENG